MSKKEIAKINTTPSKIIKAIHSGKAKTPFIDTIFLTSDIVAGTSYVDNIKDLEPKLKINDKLDFVREKNNLYDSKAILIKHNGIKIGYFPRNNNEILSNLMDAGKLIYGIIKSKSFIGEWLKINLEVFLEE
ncbi:MAG: HIRAN domain-containing protein [Methanobacteriaceae archaeon]|jgi:hypothetical protein|nr:HIRAN domain-containing protein [Methanobacteriaceae archaeon]